jgi:hypothetical protein
VVFSFLLERALIVGRAMRVLIAGCWLLVEDPVAQLVEQRTFNP